MIPNNIKKEHILLAIKENKKNDTPPQRKSKNYWLVYRNEYYAPKYILSLANKYVNGKELDSTYFHGGKESNNYLKSLGFIILNKRALKTTNKTHNERCKSCKEAVKIMLKKIYGKVQINHNVKAGTSLGDFRNTEYYNFLSNIYKALQNYRGFRKFIKTRTLPNCDYFIPDPGFIVEFDESQHFTSQRKITLKHYPQNLVLGFNKNRWMTLCKQINKKDNEPLYRDEQRAWYDTLRDFIPAIKRLYPTVRLYSREFIWCNLFPNNKKNIKTFESILRNKLRSVHFERNGNMNPIIGRIIIAGKWNSDVKKARHILKTCYRKWPKDKIVKIIITCGGFIQYDWPQNISKADIGDNKYPNSRVVTILIKQAEKYVKNNIISNDMRKELTKVTDYLTLGIDSYKEPNNINEPHIELVCLIDLNNNKYYWTGKSYPMVCQQKGLIRISNLKSHFLKLNNIGSLMLLGCHDLNIFNPRTITAKGWRRRVNKEFRILAKKQNPKIVLQHPHTTDSVFTWAAAWGGLRKILSTVTTYASAGRFDKSRFKDSKLKNILIKTKYGDTIDFIVYINNNYKLLNKSEILINN